MDKQSVNDVLLNTFVISKKRYRVFYHAGILVWEAEKSKKEKTSVPVSDIISVVLSSTSSGKSNTQTRPGTNRTTYGTTDIANPSINGDVDFDRVFSPSTSGPATISSQHIPNRERVNAYEKNECQQMPLINANYLIINYAKLTSNSSNKWRAYQLVLYNNEQRIVKLWFNQMSNDIKAQNRPRKLLLFLNPFGGKKNATNLYRKYGKPLFDKAKIDVNLIETQRAQQIHDILMSNNVNLNNYDGIVSCGGDGTFSELFNGLIYRTMVDLGMDINNPPYLPRPKIPIGIIPAGSTDTVCYCLNGTTDIKTSIIHIILGQVSGLDISSVYRINRNRINDDIQHQLLKLYASVISYGYLGDIAHDSEKYRWMGPKRYDYSGFKKFLKNRGYEGEVTINIESNQNDDVVINKNNPNDGIKCIENCQRCYLAQRNNQASCDNDEVTIKGKFFMVNGANISCACFRSPNGFSPYCHLGDGYLDLILVKHTTFFNNLRLLLTMSSKNKKIADLPFVEIYRTKKFTFKGTSKAFQNNVDLDTSDSINSDDNNLGNLSNSTQPISGNDFDSSSIYKSRWNCDGEVVHDSNIFVRSNCQLIRVFRRGIPSSDTSSKDENVSHCCGIC